MKSIPQLKLIADDLFRKHVHSLYPDWVNCPTCGENYANEELQIGHSDPRDVLPCRWDTNFATLQCKDCNYSGVMEEPLKEWFRKQIPGWDELRAQAIRKIYKRWEIEEIIEQLKS